MVSVGRHSLSVVERATGRNVAAYIYVLVGERSELITFAASAEHERTGFD
jgi:hypothetical protein